MAEALRQLKLHSGHCWSGSLQFAQSLRKERSALQNQGVVIFLGLLQKLKSIGNTGIRKSRVLFA